MSAIIIAEAGVNHNGDISRAKKMIDIAAESGADFVKFQTFKAERMVTAKAAKARYQILNTEESESQQEMLRKFELSENDHVELIAHSSLKGIKFFSTGFDIASIDLLINLGQEIFKIPSGEITNLPLLRHVGRQQKPVILSTGMSNLEEIKSALFVLEESGAERSQITVLQCTTAYPTPMSDVNLRAMQSFKDELKISVGYSDHTLGIEIPIAAVSLGASIIEKHFTLDRTLPGPDHRASLEPEELKKMIKGIRNVEVALGDGIKRLMPSEIENLPIARKSIVTKKTIMLGEDFSEENLTTKRPATGISPMKWDMVLRQKALRNYEADELIDET
jgi:N,N'-diacetyllegionaminate synthase